MKKYIIGAVLSIGLLISPAFAHQVQADGFTSTQIDSIIGLLQAFNADQSVIDSVSATLGGGTTTTIPIDTKAVDVFLIAGQSNAVGYGDATQSPIPLSGTVLDYYNGRVINASDPVGNASNGSAWPSFGITYHNATGHIVVLVPSAIGGTSQTAAASTGNGTWDETGTLFDTSVSKLDSSMVALSQAGYTPTLKGVLWDQGETDAIAINKGLITADEYQAALVKMIERYRTQYGSSMPFYIFQTGTSPTESDVGYAAVRAVQAQIPNIDPYTRIVFQGAVGFPSRSLMKDAYHYTQAGYNEMGKIGAQNIVASGITPAVAAPTVTSSFNPSTISPTGSTVYSYSSTNTTHCVSSHPGQTGGWDNIATNASLPPTTYYASQFPNGLTTTITCYNATGQSAVSTQTLTVTPLITYCTSWSYGAFGSCQSNNTQTRAVSASSPAGCTGGSPVVTQGCTYVPPVTTLATPTFTVAPHFYSPSITTTGSTGFTWTAANATHCVVSHPNMNLVTYDSQESSFDSGSGAFLGSTYYPGGLTSQVTCYNGAGTSGPSVTSPTATLTVSSAVTASWSPPSATISSGGTIPKASYSSMGADHCSVYSDTTSTTPSWSPAPTSWSQSNMGPYTAGFTHKLICYSSTGVASSPAYFTLTVTNQTASALNAFNSATNSASSQSPGPGNTTTFHYVWNNNLQIGSSYTEDVKALQTALTHEGLYTREISGGFYNQTYLAVKAFQQKYGIDTGTSGAGFVGSKTRAKLNTLY